jgi:ubiquinone/menaquinone biosynthesis C-methylase UbiE
LDIKNYIHERMYKMSEKGHSEDYFKDDRDFWWNRDFFELLARRWELNKYSKLLDVGCGLCHWSKLFSNYLKQPSEIIAIDYDSKWAKGNKELEEYFNKRNATIKFLQGDAQELPFEDNTFDVVTCQTVLIHLKNPLRALAEMKRVLKKGGILICAEMNNIAGALVKSTIIDDEPVEDTLDRIRYHLMYERGKKILGEGDNSMGDLLPGYFAETGLKSIKVYLSDKASPIIPPYDTEEEKAILNTLEEWVENDEGGFDYQQALRYFKAVSEKNEDVEFFNRQWQKMKDEAKRQNDYISKKQFSTGGAYVMYVVSGIKKEE